MPASRRTLLTALALLPLAAPAQPARAQPTSSDGSLWAKIKPSYQAINSQVVGVANRLYGTPERLQIAYDSLEEMRQLVKTLPTTPTQRERFNDWYVAKRAEAGEAYRTKQMSNDASDEASKAGDRMRLAFED